MRWLVVHGQVIHQETRKGVAHVNIGIPKSKYAIGAFEDGNFKTDTTRRVLFRQAWNSSQVLSKDFMQRAYPYCWELIHL